MKEQRYSQRSTHRRGSAAVAVVLAIAWAAAPAAAQDPRAPEAVGSISAQTTAAGQSASIDLTPYFSDPDGDALAYAATVSNVAIATVSVSGNILTIAGVAPGDAVVTVFASDPGGLSATQRAEVTVAAPNRAPEPVGTIPSQTLARGQWVSISVSSYFRDPEGETLSFAATTSNAAAASVAVAEDIVTVTHVGTGTAIVNVVARDPDGLSVQQSITVAAVSDQVTPVSARPEAERPVRVQPERGPPEPPQPQRAQPAGPAMTEAFVGERGAVEAPQPNPFPPRLLAGFVASTGHTLARGGDT